MVEDSRLDDAITIGGVYIQEYAPSSYHYFSLDIIVKLYASVNYDELEC